MKSFQDSTKSYRAGLNELLALLATSFHPNVVRLLGLIGGIHQLRKGDLRFVLKFESGGSLDRLLGKIKLNHQLLLSILGDVARGLAHMHKRGLIHCDIAARNIFMSGPLASKAVIADLASAVASNVCTFHVTQRRFVRQS